MPEHITYRREDDGRWRWLYVNPEAEVELRSSKTYPSASEARHAAAELYPGVALDEVTAPSASEDELASRKLLRQAAVSLILLAVLFRVLKGGGDKRDPGQPPPRGRRRQQRGRRQHRGVRFGPPRSL
ncbi:MAG: hypothetical protein H0T12_09125 [Actinobacteria bacterium]|nr:hypothetical protein [Actinomycetota bacterium]